MFLDILEIVVVGACLTCLYSVHKLAFFKHSESASLWRATITPLASIIGSGFLVSGPLLVINFDSNAFYGMAIIVAIAYLLGYVIRINICLAEPVLEKGLSSSKSLLHRLEKLSALAITLAYFVSVAFYIRLMAAFA